MKSMQFLCQNGDLDIKLIIDRSDIIDLFPFFKSAFNNVDLISFFDNQKKLEASKIYREIYLEKEMSKRSEFKDDLAILSFNLHEFYSAFAHYKKENVISFLESIVDKTDFLNEIMLYKVSKFEEKYSPLIFYHKQDSFVIYTPDFLSKDIEEMVDFKHDSPKWIFNFDAPKFKGKLTHAYKARYAEQISNKLIRLTENEPRKLVRCPTEYMHYNVPDRLNLFSIVDYYKLPTDNLEIVKKS